MEVVMRGIDTPVRKMRREIFKEIAQLAYHSDNLNDDVEALPYKILKLRFIGKAFTGSVK